MLGGAKSNAKPKQAGRSPQPRQQLGQDTGGRRGGSVRYVWAPAVRTGQEPAKATRWAVRALLLSLVFVTLVLVILPRAAGLQSYAATTDAMAPSYPRGTLLLVKPVVFKDLQHGDVITFQPDSGRADFDTRRIAGLDADGTGEKTLITRGDTHAAGDPVVVSEPQVKGKVLYALPFLGHLVTADLDSWMTVAATSLIGIGALLILRIIRNWCR